MTAIREMEMKKGMEHSAGKRNPPKLSNPMPKKAIPRKSVYGIIFCQQTSLSSIIFLSAFFQFRTNLSSHSLRLFQW